jgi:DNA-binding MarR family transcriptional regulator
MPPDNDTRQLLHHWREAVPDDRLAHLVRDVARAQQRALQQRLTAHGVSFGHWTFLRILWTRDGLTQKELSELAGVMEPTTFSAVKAMEQMGLIERRQLAGNRKNMHVFLTREGRALEKKLVPLAEEVNHISVRGMTDKTVATLRRALVAMIENLAAEEAEGGAPAEEGEAEGLAAAPARTGGRGRQML